MKINKFELFIGSGFLTGFISIASGTFGSFVATLIYLVIPNFEKPYIIFPVIFITFFYGIYVAQKFEMKYGNDPAQCTIDEFVGTWIAFSLIPKKLILIAIAFVVWRLLDIFKPFPAKQSEKVKGGLGIMLDDVISGIYTVIILEIVILLKII
ncbi:MAG: phosphatidylglycerophosphatase A [Ignavibacteriales bacterium]|nr:phosphatidylglycerophosphatase A [Ignavibacteriales bacterium]